MSVTAAGAGVPYLDAGLPVEARVADLLSRMTLDEKLAQLGSAWVFQMLSGADFSVERAREVLKNGLGQVTRIAGASSLTPDRAAVIANSIQRVLVEETRLGIPAIVHEEICSGVMARGSTVFPQALGMAATFQPELNRRLADTMRSQMRATGSHQGLSPVLDVTRDPRWGRSEETYGEDPHLVARMGSEFVRGLQGESLSSGVIATAKHFVGYGVGEGGMNWAPAHLGDREMREVYLHPFEAAVTGANVRSVMNGYHEIDGIPCAANTELMNDILREEWEFDGIVVSDYFAVNQLAVYHHLASDKVEAAAIALKTGIDSELPSTDCYADALATALDSGEVDMTDIDRAVARTLALKFELGLFEDPFVDEDTALDSTDTPEHRALALETARRSMVLLSNDGTLPLAGGQRIAVIGPNADTARNLFGDYAYPAHIESLLDQRDRHNVFSIPIPDDVTFESTSMETSSILAALRDRFGESITYARGCGVNDDDTSGIAEAVETAAAADVVVLVVGDKAGLTTDCTTGEGRDRSSLDLPGVQEALARAVIETGTPVVTVLVVGRPCGSPYLLEKSAGVVVAWLPGQEGGEAVADILSGEFNPGGKLPISFPHGVGQIPVFYGHKVSGGRSHWHGDYVDGPSQPIYPFGHGLSYTSFVLDEASVETPGVGKGESARVSVRLTNTGSRAGEEVVQVYIRDPEASVTRPVLELKAFARVGVEPGAVRRVTFDIPLGQLGFHGQDLSYVVEEGAIEFFVGASSSELIPAGSTQVTAAGPITKVFDGTVSVT